MKIGHPKKKLVFQPSIFRGNVSFREGTPWKINGWNLQITYLERKTIFQTSMIMFHVNLQGCTFPGKTQWLFNSDIPKFSAVINVAVSNARTSVSQETPCSRKDVTSSKSNILSQWFNQQVIHQKVESELLDTPEKYMWYVYHNVYIYIIIFVYLWKHLHVQEKEHSFPTTLS